MVYLFEFVSIAGDGRRSLIENVTLRAPSVVHARETARSMLRDVVFHDRRPDACVIKDQMGHVLGGVTLPRRQANAAH
jgi:hypothetical protein